MYACLSFGIVIQKINPKFKCCTLIGWIQIFGSLLFTLYACLLCWKKILMILWSSQILKNVTQFSAYFYFLSAAISWSRAHLRMGFFSFPCLKISSLEVSFWFFLFSLINPFFAEILQFFDKRKMESVVIWRKKQDSSLNKSGRNRRSKDRLFTIIYDFNRMST